MYYIDISGSVIWTMIFMYMYYCLKPLTPPCPPPGIVGKHVLCLLLQTSVFWWVWDTHCMQVNVYIIIYIHVHRCTYVHVPFACILWEFMAHITDSRQQCKRNAYLYLIKVSSIPFPFLSLCIILTYLCLGLFSVYIMYACSLMCFTLFLVSVFFHGTHVHITCMCMYFPFHLTDT